MKSILFRELLGLDTLFDNGLSKMVEARQKGIEYTSVYTDKSEKELDRVIATLDGKQSAEFTKLAKKFKILKDQKDEIDEKIKELNPQIKDQVESLFDAKDEILTRVVETASLTITLSKAWKQESKKTDHEKVLLELETHLTPELIKVLEDIKNKFTVVEKAGKAPAKLMPIKFKESVELHESLLDKLKELGMKFQQAVTNWGQRYDAKLNKLRNMI